MHMELSLEDLLKQIDETKYLTLESTTAIDSFGCDIVPRLRNKLSLDEKNKNLSEDDIWDQIKDRQISSDMVRNVLFKDR